MIALRTWKIISCVADLFIVVLFVVQVLPNGSIHDQIFQYNPGRSSVDIVGVSILRTLIQVIVYIIVKSTSIIPELVLFGISILAAGAKGYFLYNDNHSGVDHDDSMTILIYSVVVTLASLIGTIAVYRKTERKKRESYNKSYQHEGTTKESMWAKEAVPLMWGKSINDANDTYKTSASSSLTSTTASSLSTTPGASASGYGSNMTGLLPSEGRYFEHLPSNTNVYIHEDKPSQPSLGLHQNEDKDKFDPVEPVATKPKRMVMPSIPRLIVLMLAPGTGIPVKDVKTKTNNGDEIKRCFSGKVGVDWILTVMPRIKNRTDCLHIAQQLVDKQFILPLKPQKSKSSAPAPPKFLDDDSVLYYFTSEIESITGTYRADSNILGAPHQPPRVALNPSALPSHADRYPFERPVKGKEQEPLNQFLAPPKISSALRNFLLDMSNPHTGIPVTTHTINSMEYSNCFSGAEAVDWMMARMGLDDRDGAVKMLQSMMSKNILLPVYPPTRSVGRFEDSNAHLYTFCSISSEDQARQEVIEVTTRASPPHQTPLPPVVSPAPISEKSPQNEKQPQSDIELPQLKISQQITPEPTPAHLPQPDPSLPPSSHTPPPQSSDSLQSQQSQSLPSDTPHTSPTTSLSSHSLPPHTSPSHSLPSDTLISHTQPPPLSLQPTEQFPQSQALPPQDLPQPHQTQPPTEQTQIGQAQTEQPKIEQPKIEQPQEAIPQPQPDHILTHAPPDQSQQPLIAQEKSDAKNNKAKTKGPSLEPSVADWLNSIHCGHLVPIFDSEDITFDIIPIMEHEDLEVLGIHPNDIKVLLKHIKILKTNITKQAEDKLKQNKKKK